VHTGRLSRYGPAQSMHRNEQVMVESAAPSRCRLQLPLAHAMSATTSLASSSCTWDACECSYCIHLQSVPNPAHSMGDDPHPGVMRTSLSICRPMDSPDRSDTIVLKTDLLKGGVPVQPHRAGW
jgi:hypothetical protein